MPTTTSRTRILVIDDNHDIADLIVTFLQEYGYDAKHAYDGPTALTIVGNFRPDVVFCDIGMPIMNGFEVALRLREHPSGSDARLVALTAWGDQATRAKAFASGFDAHLVKPSTIDDLLHQIGLRNLC